MQHNIISRLLTALIVYTMHLNNIIITSSALRSYNKPISHKLEMVGETF